MTLRTKLTFLVSLNTLVVLALAIAPTLHIVRRTARRTSTSTSATRTST